MLARAALMLSRSNLFRVQSTSFVGNIREPTHLLEAPGIHLRLDLPSPSLDLRLRRKCFRNKFVSFAADLCPPGVATLSIEAIWSEFVATRERKQGSLRETEGSGFDASQRKN